MGSSLETREFVPEPKKLLPRLWMESDIGSYVVRQICRSPHKMSTKNLPELLRPPIQFPEGNVPRSTIAPNMSQKDPYD